MSKTVQELMRTDNININDDGLLYKMANNDEYIKPLSLFKNTILIGNIKDEMVPIQSALLLNDFNQHESIINNILTNNSNNNYISQSYDNSINEIELKTASTINDESSDDMNSNVSNNVWYLRLKNEIKWKRIIMYTSQKWNKHKAITSPIFCTKHGKQVFSDIFKTNFLF